MSTEENKAVVRRWFDEVMTQGNISTVDLICMQCHPGFTVINGIVDNPPPGMDGVKELVKLFRNAFPDMRFNIEEQIAEGNKVTTRMTIHGTHHGDFMGIPASSKPVSFSAISIWEVADGKLLQERVNWDALGALQQLGAIPTLGQAS
ncbi:MAG: ester cyclase [Chloroflexi bacterium]|nr:MAG: ester cyclase [Chloroflexota bacterium]